MRFIYRFKFFLRPLFCHNTMTAVRRVFIFAKVTAWVIAVSAMQGLAVDAYAQRLNLVLKNASLEEALAEIRKQSKYIVWYEEHVLDESKRITIDAKNVTLEDALKLVFERQSLTYQIIGKTIVIKHSEGETGAPNPVQQELIEVSGKVRLMVNGMPRTSAGINIHEKGQRRMISTNSAGLFTVKVPKGTVLVFSMVGYKSREMRIDSAQPLDIVLEEDMKDLDEVVVTGYQTQERRTITGAMAQVKGAEFENMPIQSFDQAMQGRMAGVLVQGGSGVPGGPVKVEIRGQGSISAGTQPLYIVDGAEINAEDAADNITASNPLAFLNPEDIESIEVLKDAAAASIYGAQAANGVVLITTKQGKAGKTSFTANYYKGITEPMPLMEMMNTQQYLNVRMEAVGNLNPDWSYERVRTEVLSQSQLDVTLTDEQIAALPTYDWQGAAFRTGNTDNLQLVASGGTERTTFRISTSLNRTEGNVVANDFTRGTVYLRLNHDVNRRLKLMMSTNLSSTVQNGSYRSWGSYSYFSSPQYTAPLMLPFLPIYLEDGSFNAPIERFPGNLPYNAIHVADVNTQVARTQNLLGNFSLTYDITKDLTFQSRFGLNYRIYDTEFYIDPRTQEAYARQGYKSFRYQPSTTFTTSHTLVYNKTLPGGHNFNALLGAEYRDYHMQRGGGSAEGFPSHQFRYLSSAATILSLYENNTANKRGGLFSQLNYNYMKKYMLSAVLRYDGSSRFGANNRFGWFPAFSAGWDVSQEMFARDIEWMQQLKLRASYGETGNSAIGNFAARALWDGSGSHAGRPGTVMVQMGNDDLRWERNVTTNLGLDFSLFNRKLYGAVDVFHRRSADLLISTPLPWTSGFAEVYRNVGEVVNKGLEVELNSNLVRTKDFKWTSSFNISFLRNKVTKLYKGIVEDGEDIDAPIVEQDVESLPGNPGIRLGWPLHTNFRQQYAGVNAATGKPMWWSGHDRLSYSPGTQGSGSYTPYGRGNRLSDYFGGFINTFTYKNLEFGIFFQYDMGRELYNNSNGPFYRNGETQSNSTARAYNLRWQEPGQITAFPRPIDGGREVLAESMSLASSRYLEDASYIRLKQLSLNYKVPGKYTDRLKLSNVEVYAQATNVLTWTKWTGYDPEFYIDDSNFSSNTGQIPQTRAYTMGIKMNF
ncbi:TonB-linked outer membrane protein, SusC/RagA family [Parapedobacter composti]|uniref:TonB-linked outer membrane protein, SusC/RagA family n=2 Tax=Parapedobacter composti TaxID=623281 RepID=A0A1I1E7J5_9SPHI|nr:TonB-linked outer membrane protein, SusC/RagA family [Parapedobacter composti]